MRSEIHHPTLSHLKKSWKHHGVLQFATLMVLTACFSVVISTLTLGQNMMRILTLWGDSIQMSVYLSEKATEEDIDLLSHSLRDNRKLDKVQYVSKEEALEQFRKQMSSYAPDLLADKDLLKVIPSSFQFSLNSSIPPQETLAATKEIVESMKELPGVDEVIYGQEWVKNYSSLIQSFHWLGGVVISILFLASLFILSNSIHSSIHQRREEIEIYELIGATQKYIRKPYIWEGAILSGFAFFVSTLFTIVLFSLLKYQLSAQLSFLHLSNQIQFLSSLVICILFVLSLVLGAIASYFCVRKINSGWAASQRNRS